MQELIEVRRHVVAEDVAVLEAALSVQGEGGLEGGAGAGFEGDARGAIC